MRKHLYVDGVDLATYGVYCSGQGTFGSPAKVYAQYDVPGKNGITLGMYSKFENIEVTYPCFVYANFSTNMASLRSFLLSRDGYVEVKDDYHTDEIRLGFFAAPIVPEVTTKNDAGSFDLVFNCLPQRYLTTGQTATTITTATIFTNPTQFPAKPLLRVYGTGRVGVESAPSIGETLRNIYITDAALTSTTPHATYVDVDCEAMTFYNSKGMNVARYCSVTDFLDQNYGVDLPQLWPAPKATDGKSSVGFTPGVGDTYPITKVDVTPRWWRL